MIGKQETVISSPFIAIYNYVVPQDHLLRQFKELVDFSFILDELQDKYCLDNGRNSVPPVRMFKYLVLKAVYDLSDVDLVKRSLSDMAFKYFLDMAPEEDVIDSSSLSKFRKLRLTDEGLLDLLLEKTVEVALEQGILTSKTLIVDATHTTSRYQKKAPLAFLKEKAKQVRKAVYSVDESFKDRFPEKVTANDVNEEIGYCRALIDVIEQQPVLADRPAVNERINVLKEVVEDCQEQLAFSADPDARTGHKSAEDSFFGYKTHLAMSDERIVTAAVITTGEATDGKYLQELIEKTEKAGMTVDTVLGDTAYSEKENLKYAKKQEIKLISRLHPLVTEGNRKPENTFEFNKDAGMFVCPAGHLAIKKHKQARKNEQRNMRFRFLFDIEKCKVCPLRDGCYKEGAKTKSYSLTIKADIHQEQADFQNSERFKALARERYKIEAKNDEIKNGHGYHSANGAGLFSMRIQGATTLFAVNLKRIIKLKNEKEQQRE